MKKRIVSLFLSLVLILPTISFAADDFNGEGLNAALLADYKTGDILYSQNLNQRIEVASITKIMTNLVAMDEVSKGNVSLSDKVTISEKASKRGGSSFKLKAGQVHSLEKLLESSMIASANDACIAIAEHVSGSEEEFIKLMNKKAIELGLDRSYFVSVNGFPEEGTHNTMSVEDIFKLTVYTMDTYPEIMEITNKKTLVDKERDLEFTNTNPLLGTVPGVDGFKTGYADEAGYCLVSTKVVDDSRLIGIVMGAETQRIRREKSLELLEGKLISKFNRDKILDKQKEVEVVAIPGSANGNIDVYPEDDLYGLVREGEKISKSVNVFNILEFPIRQGEPIGEITVEYNGNIKTMNLVAKEDIRQNTIVNTAVIAFRNFISSVF